MEKKKIDIDFAAKKTDQPTIAQTAEKMKRISQS